MAFRAKKLRISHLSKVAVTLGRKKLEIVLSMPIQRLTEQAVKTVFGKKATIRR